MDKMYTVARYLRSITEFRIAKTWQEYFSPPVHRLTVYDALCFMKEQFPHERSEVLGDVIADVFPELFSDYWEQLPV